MYSQYTEEDYEYGECCYCKMECNISSQACGSCMRSMTNFNIGMAPLPPYLEKEIFPKISDLEQHKVDFSDFLVQNFERLSPFWGKCKNIIKSENKEQFIKNILILYQQLKDEKLKDFLLNL